MITVLEFQCQGTVSQNSVISGEGRALPSDKAAAKAAGWATMTARLKPCPDTNRWCRGIAGRVSRDGRPMMAVSTSGRNFHFSQQQREAGHPQFVFYYAFWLSRFRALSKV